MNLFKSRCVNSDDCNWQQYGIKTSHNLRSYFVSYMFLQDVRIEDVIEMLNSAATLSTRMGFFDDSEAYVELRKVYELYRKEGGLVKRRKMIL